MLRFEEDFERFFYSRKGQGQVGQSNELGVGIISGGVLKILIYTKSALMLKILASHTMHHLS